MNRWLAAPLATLLRDRKARAIPTVEVLAAIRATGEKSTGAKIDAVIADVLSRDDQCLSALIEAVEIVEASEPQVARAALANGLGLDPRADADAVLDGLLGWLSTKVRNDWSEGRPALISRREVLTQSHVLQDVQRRSRFLPRASADLHVTDDERDRALARNFVEHLGRISAGQEDVLQAVEHFLKFSMEKHRLVRGGDVPMAEWSNRSRRLRERWGNIMRRRKREMVAAAASSIGQAVLADATYDHRESLDGHPCDELYMTSGNYHRLAESDEVWWDPGFESGGADEG